MTEYHINPDGKVPCTNCGEEIVIIARYVYGNDPIWIHVGSTVACYEAGPEVACPLPPNDDRAMYDDGTLGSVGIC